MCKAGDIILIDKYLDHGQRIGRHSFVVISDQNGKVEGVPYDFIANALSSFKGETQKARKLKYPGNFPITHNDTVTDPDNGRDGYIKADQLYFFNKEKIEYRVIGKVMQDVFSELLKFIQESNFEIVTVTDNL